MRTVIIEVSGGVAEVTSCPDDVEVIIIDHDNEEAEAEAEAEERDLGAKTMINDLETYSECGRHCAKARNERDETRALFQRNWLGRALLLETEFNRHRARDAFDAAYKAERQSFVKR